MVHIHVHFLPLRSIIALENEATCKTPRAGGSASHCVRGNAVSQVSCLATPKLLSSAGSTWVSSHQRRSNPHPPLPRIPAARGGLGRERRKYKWMQSGFSFFHSDLVCGLKEADTGSLSKGREAVGMPAPSPPGGLLAMTGCHQIVPSQTQKLVCPGNPALLVAVPVGGAAGRQKAPFPNST